MSGNPRGDYALRFAEAAQSSYTERLAANGKSMTAQTVREAYVIDFRVAAAIMARTASFSQTRRSRRTSR
jgi:hypothetical protein